MFVDHQILIFDWFVKDHVTLKTGVMMKNSDLIKAVYSHRKLMIYTGTIFHCFYYIFDQINAALESRINSFRNIIKKKHWTVNTYYEQYFSQEQSNICSTFYYTIVPVILYSVLFLYKSVEEVLSIPHSTMSS